MLFGYLRELGVDGLMISPAYGYEAVVRSRIRGRRARTVHDAARKIHEKFRAAEAFCGGSG